MDAVAVVVAITAVVIARAGEFSFRTFVANTLAVL